MIAWQDLGAALALWLVLEGMLPFLNPQGLRRLMLVVSELPDRQLRLTGAVSMGLGVLVLYLVRG